MIGGALARTLLSQPLLHAAGDVVSLASTIIGNAISPSGKPLWKMLGQMCQRAGLGTEPRKVLDELSQIKAVDVVMPTMQGSVLRRRCIAQPTKAQATLLQTLHLHLPQRIRTHKL